MTFEEAKKILEKEGFRLEGPGKPCSVSEDFTELESPDICEAMQIVCSAGYSIMMLNSAFNARKVRLKEQLEEHSNAPMSGSPALKEAASQFNDALLDEQAKKIEKLTKENEDWKSCHEMQNRAIAINNIVFRDEKNRLGKEIARLNKIIHKKNMKIEELRKESSSHLRGKVKLFVETVDLSQEICDKNEELRLTKIREKNLTEVCQKYMKENEKLKKELADKVVDKIDAQALKSAESALACKEQLIYYKDKIIANNKKKIAEKDEVIADLGKELAATKKQLEEKTKLVEIIRNGSKEYCDYGVAANEFIKKLAGLYILANNTGIINDEMLERCKNYQTYGFPANCNRETKKEIDDIASGKTKAVGVDKAEEGADQSGKIVLCGNGITFSKEEAKIIERCTKNGTELHYSEKNGLTYTNVYGEEMPISCLRGMFHVFTDEEIRNLKK